MSTNRIARLGKAAEDAALVLLLGAMIVLATTQIVMRNGFDAGFIWADETLRLMVLWVAMAGAVAASRADKHISIDVLSRFLPARGRAAARIVTNGFTTAICALLAWHSWRFVSQSMEFEDTLLGNLPAWWFQIVMPVAFALMSWRYLCLLAADVVALINGDAVPTRDNTP